VPESELKNRNPVTHRHRQQRQPAYHRANRIAIYDVDVAQALRIDLRNPGVRIVATKDCQTRAWLSEQLIFDRNYTPF